MLRALTLALVPDFQKNEELKDISEYPEIFETDNS
jgi:hypothetical protein